MYWLWITDGGINDEILADNMECIKSHWSHPTPVELVFRQIKTYMLFATKGVDPITSASAIRTGISIIENNGHFSFDCKDWRARSAVNRTLANFYQHFWKAEKEFKIYPITTTGCITPTWQCQLDIILYFTLVINNNIHIIIIIIQLPIITTPQ